MTADFGAVMTHRRLLLTAAPPFHPVAVKLLRVLDGSPQNLGRIVALLRSDAVMIAEVTRAANSPLFGSRYPITNPLSALVYLGLERVKALATTAAMKSIVDATKSGFRYACWRHNLATAVICQKLAVSVNLPPERCYIGGLIHDLGRLALLASFPKLEHSYMLAGSGARDRLRSEKDIFGLNHAEAGSWLLSQWGCPIEMQNIAAFHENPSDAPLYDRPVVSLVRAASQLADWMGMSMFPSDRHEELTEIAHNLSEIAGVGLSLEIDKLTEWVATQVNGMELSLL